MTQRLHAIAQEIIPCTLAVDVGCDHGYISQYIVKNKLAKTVIAADISEQSLQKAKTLLAAQFPETVQFRAGDGLSVLQKGELPDCIVIAGMGGLEIIKILTNAGTAVWKQARLILSPHRNAYDLRGYLVRNACKLDSDYCIEDGGKFYDVIVAVPGSDSLTREEQKFGRTNIEIKSSAFYRRLQQEYQTLFAHYGQTRNEQVRAKAEEVLAMMKKVF